MYIAKAIFTFIILLSINSCGVKRDLQLLPQQEENNKSHNSTNTSV
jgi:hypothetical protein